jgi:hypothetical protein
MSTGTLLRIDEQIIDMDKVICRHIDNLGNHTRGMVSQDILSQLRNFVEHIMLKIYANGQEIENSYDNICRAIDYVKSQGNIKVLKQFHEYLQIVASHYTLNEENSERLMLKYYEYLLKIKKLLQEYFSLNVLGNLEKFPLNTDSDLQVYYEKITSKINMCTPQNATSEKYYIQKIKPLFIKQKIYYEVTFTPANDYASKFNRVIAFTSLEITDNYAVKFALVHDSIEILGKTMPIIIITGWEVAIRDCEFKNFTSLIRGKAVPTGYSEQMGISLFLKTGFNLTELVDFSESEFQKVKQQATHRVKVVVFFNDLERCREILQGNRPGSNIIRYLLYHMNNKVIKSQQDYRANHYLSGLYVKYGCIPFDKMPFNTSPIGHNPKLTDLFACIDTSNRQHEILARLVRNNTEINGQLFTPVKDITEFDDLTTLVRTYNDILWHGHREYSKLVIEAGHIFINGFKNDTRLIIDILGELAERENKNYSISVQKWLSEPGNGVDCDEKKEALWRMFEKSSVALMYGSAGTGKTTFINHIAHFFSDKSKLFLAQTNPAVDNLKRRVKASNCSFSTITKFLKKKKGVTTDYDLLIIDECSTVNNRDMKDILSKATYQLLILVGDSYQISSIRFGNWFSLASEFVPNHSVFELTKPYRSNNQSLLILWDRVRKMDATILELITRQGYSATLDASIFASAEVDEIILCLNYDGLYGINNINRFLQESNPNIAVPWGIQQYKINDPILFNESDRFAPVIYNNMKGRIVGIEILDSEKFNERIQFDVELDKAINGIDAYNQDFELLGSGESGNSIIRFCVNKLKSADEDDDNSSMSIVPFQVAYAVSIHKAQGLEYNSVKIVITAEIDELITHNIFYTAITRARNKLKIYWTPEVEQKVLSSIKPKKLNKDINLLKIIQ